MKDDEFGALIVEFLVKNSPVEQWNTWGIGCYLRPKTWVCTERTEVDFDPMDGEPAHIVRVFEQDVGAILPGRVIVSCEPDDSKIVSINAFKSNQRTDLGRPELLAKFIKLANGDAPLSRPPIPQTTPEYADFGSW